MNDRDLDGVIELVAQEMTRHEPSRQLVYRVMSRVRATPEPASRWFVWVGAATAGAALLVAVLVSMTISRAPVFVPPDTTAAVGTLPDQEPVSQVSEAAFPFKTRPPDRTSRRARGPQRGSSISMPPPLNSEIEPLEAEPITLSAIEVTPLENQAPAIDEIQIEVLTIEPLTASND